MQEKIDPNQPAFPVPPLGDTSTPEGYISHQFPGSHGMTYRQWLIGQAVTCAAGCGWVDIPVIAARCIMLADAVIAKLNQESNEKPS